MPLDQEGCRVTVRLVEFHLSFNKPSIQGVSVDGVLRADLYYNDSALLTASSRAVGAWNVFVDHHFFGQHISDSYGACRFHPSLWGLV